MWVKKLRHSPIQTDSELVVNRILIAIILFTPNLYSQKMQLPFDGIKLDENTEIYLYEGFPEKNPWRVDSNNTMEIKTRFLEKLPPLNRVDKENLSPYEKILSMLDNIDNKNLQESQKYFFNNNQAPAKFSHETQIYFTKPGVDFLTLRKVFNGKAKSISGRPVAIAVWVYGFNQKHKLIAQFSNSRKQIHDVSLGTLEFNGWERLETKIPPHIQVKNVNSQNHFDFQFIGFKIVSHPRSQPDLAVFQFTRVMLLIDHQQKRYPGVLQKEF